MRLWRTAKCRFLCNYSSSNQSNPYLPVFEKQRVNSLLMSFPTTTTATATAIKRYRSKGQMPSKAVKLQRRGGGGGGGINAHSFSHHQHQEEEEGKQGALIETIEVVVVVIIAGSVCFSKLLLLPLIKCHLNCAVQCK